jgi:hypothetical protein
VVGEESDRRVRIGHEHETLLVQRWSDNGQQDGEEYEGVDGPERDYSQIHAEVEDLKDFRFCKCQNQNAAVGQSDTRQDLYHGIRG